jgi:hypothetical protein
MPSTLQALPTSPKEGEDVKEPSTPSSRGTSEYSSPHILIDDEGVSHDELEHFPDLVFRPTLEEGYEEDDSVEPRGLVAGQEESSVPTNVSPPHDEDLLSRHRDGRAFSVVVRRLNDELQMQQLQLNRGSVQPSSISAYSQEGMLSPLAVGRDGKHISFASRVRVDDEASSIDHSPADGDEDNTFGKLPCHFSGDFSTTESLFQV